MNYLDFGPFLALTDKAPVLMDNTFLIPLKPIGVDGVYCNSCSPLKKVLPSQVLLEPRFRVQKT
ncbi:MAG: hypothetical protein ACI89U_002970 [Gammaproteobacteria bacterium]|jgi:hypothetical protein